MVPSASTTRTVTLVIAVDGTVVGTLEPFVVDTPWWMDVLPITTRHPELAVVRILEGHPAEGSTFGGDVSYLAEPRDAREVDPRSLRPWDGELTEDPLRLPWAQCGGPRADLAWAGATVQLVGAPVQFRTWNLSAIWLLPTDQGTVWLKCVPPFLEHEAAVIALLGDQPVPTLIAAQGHRMLLEAMPGEDGYHASFKERRDLIDLLVDLQCATIGRTDAFAQAGAPDRRWPALLEAASDVVRRRATDDRVLLELLETADRRVAAIEACGLPDVLVHGDAHSGNARVGEGAGRGVWFDWGDARVGHPLLDVAVLERPGTSHAPALTQHWLRAWRRRFPEADPARAWQLVRPFAALGDAVVYQGFLDHIESSERVYHEGDVLPALERAAAMVSQEASR